ncbi:hypothetical protein [Virgibacillus halodenitrificans]|nr:hypothetical protein [Virgibacillus halodenitrificans]
MKAPLNKEDRLTPTDPLAASICSGSGVAFKGQQILPELHNRYQEVLSA